jgi:Cdc6-like AAA superfamily ATPase
LVPLNGHGALAQADKKTQVTEEYSHLKLKSGGTFQIVESVDDILPESKRIVTEYLGT